MIFRPLSLYIGLRYTRAKRRNYFISFITLSSMIGIALSLIILITVLSVFNGFDQQIEQRIFNMVPHITISSMNQNLTKWQPLRTQLLANNKGVVAVAPYVIGQGLMMNNGQSVPVIAKGISVKDEINVSILAKKMIAGSFSDLAKRKFGLLIGSDLARRLSLIVGDKVMLFVPKMTVTPIGALPRARQFTVVGIFHIGNGFGFDSHYAFLNILDAKRLYSLPSDVVTGLQLKLNDLFQAPLIAKKLRQDYGFAYSISDWTDQYGGFYHAVRMEKSMMFLILTLLILIAVFNLLSGLMMAVTDKQADIAILRTLGATPGVIMRIFMVQGFMIGLSGTIIGLIGGLLLASHVNSVVDFLQSILHIQLFTRNVYFVNYLPSKIKMTDIVSVCSIALIASLLATIYPAYKATRIQPVEALRYE